MNMQRPFDFLHKSRRTASSPDGTAIQQKQRYLLTMDIFRDLEPAVMQRLVQQTEMRTCRKGQILYAQEDRAEVLFLLKQGRVQLYRLTPTGKRLELAIVEPGTFFGEMPLLGESLRHAYAEASENALVCVMSRTDVERLMREHPQVALRMIEVLGQRLALCEARLEEVAYRSVPARLAAVLLRLSNETQDEELRITHQEVGDLIGALRESVTKVLDDFQRAGLVELCRGRITIRDVAGLRIRLAE